MTLSELTPQRVPGSRGSAGVRQGLHSAAPSAFPTRGPLHTSALVGTSPGWGQEHKWKVLLPRVADMDGVWGTSSPGPLPAGWETEAGEEDPALTEPRWKGEDSEEGLRMAVDGPDREKVPGSGQAGQPASGHGPGLDGGCRAPAGGLLIQPNNDEMAPLSCGAKVAVTGGGVT